MRKEYNQKSKATAFSLVEMLSVIAVIGIISAIAVPGISRIRESAENASAQRNAQNLASVYVSARAAGLEFLAPNDVGATVANIVTGGTTSDGVLSGSYFGVPGLSTSEQTAAIAFLQLNGEDLLYAKVDGVEGEANPVILDPGISAPPTITGLGGINDGTDPGNVPLGDEETLGSLAPDS